MLPRNGLKTDTGDWMRPVTVDFVCTSTLVLLNMS